MTDKERKWSKLLGLLGGRKQNPKMAGHSAPDDDVYPLYMSDDTTSRRIFVARVLRFNDVLDAGMLQASLSKLLEIGDWRKLGGRLRYKESGRLEIYVPKHFTSERPAVSFTHDKSFLDTSIFNHPTASRLHIATDGPSIQPTPACHPLFATPPNFPATIDDMVRRGLPQLSLHVTSFNDATLVGLVWPHTLTDAFGISEVLRNWSLVLANREAEVSPVLGSREDVMLEQENCAEEDREPLKIEHMRLTGLSMCIWALRQVWHEIGSPAQEPRTIYLPSETLARLKSNIQREIDEMPVVDGQENFAGENDMLTAWIAHIVASSGPKPHATTTMSLFNLRAPLPLKGLYIQNLLMLIYGFLPADLLSGPVGPIAVAHRRQFLEQGTKQQVLAFMQIVRQQHEVGRAKYLFGERDSRPIFFNNVFKANFTQAIDFCPAVLSGETSKQRSNPPGTILTYYYHVYNTPLNRLTNVFMLGKDHSGGCWFQAQLRPKAWDEMQRRLDNV